MPTPSPSSRTEFCDNGHEPIWFVNVYGPIECPLCEAQEELLETAWPEDLKTFSPSLHETIQALQEYRNGSAIMPYLGKLDELLLNLFKCADV